MRSKTWHVPNSVRCVRGIHLDRPRNRTDYAFPNNWGAIVLDSSRPNAEIGELSLSRMLYDSVSDRFDFIGVEFPALDCNLDSLGHVLGYAKTIKRVLKQIAAWSPAPQPPNWQTESGTIYLIADVGPFGGGIVAKSSYHGYLGLRNSVFAQRVTGIPEYLTAERVMIARNNAITEGRLPISNSQSVCWSDISRFGDACEVGLRPVPRCFDSAFGPSFVDETGRVPHVA